MAVDQRVHRLNDVAVPAIARYVLYWCRWNRRAASNHALAFAAGLANRLERPLVYLESLTCDYPYASDRLHTFALEGMTETAATMRSLGIGCWFSIARRKGEGLDTIARAASDAAAVVTDDCPMLPQVEFDIPAYTVDSCCVVPMRAVPDRAYAAYSIRPKIHKLLPQFMQAVPPVRVRRRFDGPAPTCHTEVDSGGIARLVAECEIDHSVGPPVGLHGGRAMAKQRLRKFLQHRLRRYAAEKNEPSAQATSELSPYLHWGYISSLEVALAVRDYAADHKLIADGFLEELIVRRELAFNFARHATGTSLGDLPDWARQTLHTHRKDRRNPVYTREQLETASTCDDLWNAAQKELLLRGKIHGYYRMYWGKKVLEWSASPAEALATALYLNDRYALDGQDPNSNANILWCFGLHDRPWPERPIFGTVRWMSRGGMERKTDVKAYLREIEYLDRKGKELTA